MNDHPQVVCLKCNWVSFSVTKKQAQDEVKSFNTYFKTLTKEQQTLFYGGEKSSLKSYVCLRCGGDKFRLYEEPRDHLGIGHTINPVIWEGKNK
jgi:hypothetical protein